MLGALLILFSMQSMPGAGERVAVRFEGGLVDVRAQAVPLAEVLDAFAERTGLRIVYDDGRPVSRVTLDIQGRTPADALLIMLQGLGMNYAFTTDEQATRVTSMILSGARRDRSAPSSGPVLGGGPPADPQPMPSEPESVEPAPDTTPEDPPEAMRPGPVLGRPTMARPDAPAPMLGRPTMARPDADAPAPAQPLTMEPPPLTIEPPSLPYYPSNPPPPSSP